MDLLRKELEYLEGQEEILEGLLRSGQQSHKSVADFRRVFAGQQTALKRVKEAIQKVLVIHRAAEAAVEAANEDAEFTCILNEIAAFNSLD